MPGTSTISGGNRAYYAGVGVAMLTAFLLVWTTIVRDEGNASGVFMVILAAGVGGFACLFRPAGMARAMLGVTVMQLLLGMLIATAPITAHAPDGVSKALIYNGVAAALWLISAMFFRAAARNS